MPVDTLPGLNGPSSLTRNHCPNSAGSVRARQTRETGAPTSIVLTMRSVKGTLPVFCLLGTSLPNCNHMFAVGEGAHFGSHFPSESNGSPRGELVPVRTPSETFRCPLILGRANGRSTCQLSQACRKSRTRVRPMQGNTVQTARGCVGDAFQVAAARVSDSRAVSRCSFISIAARSGSRARIAFMICRC